MNKTFMLELESSEKEIQIPNTDEKGYAIKIQTTNIPGGYTQQISYTFFLSPDDRCKFVHYEIFRHAIETIQTRAEQILNKKNAKK